MIPNRDFEGMPLFDVQYLKTIQDEYVELGTYTPYSTVWIHMTLNDIEWQQKF